MDIAGELYDKYAENISYESSENERYRELRSKLKSISVEFEKLDEGIQKTVDRYIEISSSVNDIYSETAFRIGFRLGLRIQKEMKE